MAAASMNNKTDSPKAPLRAPTVPHPGLREMSAAHPNLIKGASIALYEAITFAEPADNLMRRYFKAHPALGRRDRAFIAEAVFDALRHFRNYCWQMGTKDQGLQGRDCFALLDAVHGTRGEDRMAVDLIDPALPNAVRYSLPDWLWQKLAKDHGDQVHSIASALLNPAPLDLRVNLLKATTKQVSDMLDAAYIKYQVIEPPACGVDAKWFAGVEALRLEGKPALEKTNGFEQGWIEVQDVGSQMIAAMVGAKRGQTVIDFCAGAGGKTLAIAAAMRSGGQIYACDISLPRLQRLKPRLARSGATNVQPFGMTSENDPKLGKLKGRAHAVLVDAPCSGTGTLRRNPDLKWRFGEDNLANLNVQQASILKAASRLVRPGGALIYATCSLLRSENQDQVEKFLSEDSGWQRDVEDMVLLPHISGTDGFYAARLVKAS
jgi:16S rRNA (cytosine967-C5)-methyltransferase